MVYINYTVGMPHSMEFWITLHSGCKIQLLLQTAVTQIYDFNVIGDKCKKSHRTDRKVS